MAATIAQRSPSCIVATVDVQCPKCAHRISGTPGDAPGDATDDATAAPSVCGHCGAQLPAHEPPASLPAIDISKLAALDEVTGAAPPQLPVRAAPASAFAPPEPAVSSEMFAPPPESLAPPEIDPADQQVIGVERSTRAIRIENQFRQDKSQAALPPPLPPPPTLFVRSRMPSWRAIRIILRVALLACGLIGGGFGVTSWARHRRDPLRGQLLQTGPSSDDASTISIHVVSSEPIAVTIDGMAVGKTPLTMHVRKALQSVIVAAAGRVFPVVPDRDQVVDVSAP